ncbi:hypothetical protein [Streptomyces yokosukanensis]|uniref:hypothetical protein n=1 Tax=Streptomyces yokosukanensis TaxID=67386 RepID=UPI003CC5F062
MATGLTIAAYTVLDGLGVRASPSPPCSFFKERFGAPRNATAGLLAVGVGPMLHAA